MNIRKERWILSEEISLKEEEILHLHLKAAGFIIHPFIESYQYRKKYEDPTLCHSIFDYDNDFSQRINIFTLPLRSKDESYKRVGYIELLELLKQEIQNREI